MQNQITRYQVQNAVLKNYIRFFWMLRIDNAQINTRFSKFSDLAYDNEYYDQMHFIREFKRFTGYTPGMFVKKNNSILQIGKMG